MENTEQEAIERYEKIHSEFDKTIEKMLQDFQSENFSERLTDIYLYQHQANTVLADILKKINLEEKINIIVDKGEQALKQFQGLKGAYENKEKASKGTVNKIMKELNEENTQIIEQIESRKKQIDSDFKEKLKSLSKNYS